MPRTKTVKTHELYTLIQEAIKDGAVISYHAATPDIYHLGEEPGLIDAYPKLKDQIQGTILSSKGEVICRAMPKPMNLFHDKRIRDSSELDDIWVSEKVEGDLVYMYNIAGETYISSKYGFDDDIVSETAEIWSDRYTEVTLEDNTTYVFQLVTDKLEARAFPIEKPDLVYLTRIDNITGLEPDPLDVFNSSWSWPGPKVMTYRIDNLDEGYKKFVNDSDKIEGVVVSYVDPDTHRTVRAAYTFTRYIIFLTDKEKYYKTFSKVKPPSQLALPTTTAPFPYNLRDIYRAVATIDLIDTESPNKLAQLLGMSKVDAKKWCKLIDESETKHIHYLLDILLPANSNNDRLTISQYAVDIMKSFNKIHREAVAEYNFLKSEKVGYGENGNFVYITLTEVLARNYKSLFFRSLISKQFVNQSITPDIWKHFTPKKAVPLPCIHTWQEVTDSIWCSLCGVEFDLQF